MSFLQINDAKYYYELHGEGYPIVLISGYTGDHFYWAPILENLKQHFQVLVFDNRGIGQTLDEHPNLSAALMAEETLALAKALKLEKPHIIGQSMGGTIAQHIGARYSSEIGKLVILTSSPKWRRAMLLGFKHLLWLCEQNAEFDLIFAATLPWIYGESFLQDQAKIQTLKQARLNNPHPQSLSNQLRQYQVLETFDSRSELKNIQSPTLVGYGSQDITALLSESHFIADQIPNSILKEFNCGHGILIEQTELLTNTLIDFLTRR